MTQVISQDILRVRFPTVKTTEPWDMSISAITSVESPDDSAVSSASAITLGDIRGRKDAGGIVGQFEPYLTIDHEEDLYDQLKQPVKQSF